jgi:hypothetical protein
MGDYIPPQEQDRQTDPNTALVQIQNKINAIAKEYSAGQLNRAQFYAMYKHYTEKRTIIQKLLERNPDSDAWKAAAQQGATTYLRDRYEARVLSYVIFRQGDKSPILHQGKMPQNAAEQVHKMLRVIWKLQRWRTGLARKALGDGMWLMLVMGEQSMTLVVYFLQPSTLQMNELRDLHADFERANKNQLKRGLGADRMVFPQRSLLD